MSRPPSIRFRGRVPRSRRGYTPQAADPPLPPLAAAVIALSLLFVAAGVIFPEAAGTLLRALIATLAIGFVVVRAYGSIEPLSLAREGGSPFGDSPPPKLPPVSPEPLLLLEVQLNGVDDRRAARRRKVPVSAERTLRRDVERRLAERHGLHLRDPADHGRIRALVSDPTWRVVRPRGSTALESPVPLSELPAILDEVERL